MSRYKMMMMMRYMMMGYDDDGDDDDGGDDEEQKVITSFCQLLFVWLLVQQADLGTKDLDKSLALNAEPIEGVRTSKS